MLVGFVGGMDYLYKKGLRAFLEWVHLWRSKGIHTSIISWAFSAEIWPQRCVPFIPYISKSHPNLMLFESLGLRMTGLAFPPLTARTIA